MFAQNVSGDFANKRLLNAKEICIYIGMGKNQARKYMDKIGATRRFGGRVLFDKNVIDKALDNLKGE